LPPGRLAIRVFCFGWVDDGRFQQSVDALIYFPLGEAAAAGGGLEFNGDALVLGAPLPEPAHGVRAEFGLDRGIAEASQGALDPVEERVLGKPTQFG